MKFTVEKIFVFVIILIMIICCDNEKSKTVIEENIEITEKVSKETIVLSETIELFIENVLGENQRKQEFENSNNIRHLEMFDSENLERIIAFSDKRYPKKIEPNRYEHFTLFALEYNDAKSAKNAYLTIKKGNLDEIKKAPLKYISSIKPGGMICQKGEYIFSLVKTCRETPIGGKWETYENLFLQYITESKEEIEILTAQCGAIKYFVENREGF